jgi:hypothetical protein
MTDRRGSRFAFEVLFLLALTVALTLANLRPLEIAGIMLVGWVIVAVLEWVAWREAPHYGSGLPPRYYVPQVSLPPAQPLEPVSAGYPGARDEAPTWIASPALRAEMLGDWPVAAPPVETPPVSATATAKESELDPDPWTRAEELPAAPLGELDPFPLERHAEHVAAVIEPLPALVPPPVSVPAAAKPVPEPQPTSAPRDWALDLELARSLGSVARYNLDPLGDPQPRRRFGRGTELEPAGLEVPARPQGVRELPGRTNRQD